MPLGEDEFTAFRIMRMFEREKAERIALPIRTIACVGAQVALQRCPILRAGKNDFNLQPKNFQRRRKKSQEVT